MTAPEETLVSLLNRGVNEAMNGSKARAHIYFTEALKRDSRNETALLWLAWLSDDAYEAIRLLERVLEHNPHNEMAQSYLRQAKARVVDIDSFITSSQSYTAWQTQSGVYRRKQETPVPYLGELLVTQGAITAAQLDRAIRRHRELIALGRPKRVGEVMLELGYITREQLDAAIERQRVEQRYRFHDRAM